MMSMIHAVAEMRNERLPVQLGSGVKSLAVILFSKVAAVQN